MSAQKQNKKTDALHGLQAMLEHSLRSAKKMPMLDLVLEKFVKQLVVSFRNLVSEQVEISINGLDSVRFSDYIDYSLQTPKSICVFRAIEWDSTALISIENKMVFNFLDLLLGGHNFDNEIDVDNRTLTSIEQCVAKEICEKVLGELSNSFTQVTPSTFEISKFHTNPNFVTIARIGDAVIAVQFSVKINNSETMMELIIPYKSIEPIKDELGQLFIDDHSSSDQLDWKKDMMESINDVSFPISAVISKFPSNIENIANMKVGQTIMLGKNVDQNITLRFGSQELLKGKIGKVDDKFAVSIESKII